MMTLKRLRQESGKTPKEVADKLGVSIQAVYRYEQGTRMPSLSSVLKLAELYDCTEREIIEAQLKSIEVKNDGA